MENYNIKKIFEIFKKENINPTTELKYNSTFELLISVILSAQATDISVNKATEKLYKIANTPQDILNLGYDNLVFYIKSIGLYRNKAKNILETCKILLENFKGEVPQTRKELESLRGVGRKTANVILNTAFGKKEIAVDTHIFRISNRIGLVKSKNVLETEKNLLEVIPEEYKLNAHHWLILHGRYICKAKNYNCSKCKIVEYCNYQNKIFK